MERKAIFVSTQIHKILKVAAAENQVSMNEVITILIEESTEKGILKAKVSEKI